MGGDCVLVEEATLDIEPAKRAARSAIVRSAILDLGRLRSYFTIGGSVSQGRSNFSHVDTFVGFTTDAKLVGNIVLKEICVEDESRARRCTPVQGPLLLRDFRWQLNTFTDARLGFRLATTGGSEGSAPAAVTGGQPAAAPFQRPDQLAFGADQPGYFQFGLHAPMSVKTMDWRNDGSLYSFYVGPIAKWGVLAFDHPVVVSRTVEIDTTKPETDTARFTTVREDLRRGALPFYGYGIRTGVYRYDLLGKETRQRQVANDPVAYFDITWGKWSAYRAYTFARTLNDEGTIETVDISSAVERRVAIEGRLKIPYLPALIGVDINIRSNRRDDEPNDFRFIAAFRVDAQRALGRIFGGDLLSDGR